MGIFIQIISLLVVFYIFIVSMRNNYLKGRKDVLVDLLENNIIDYPTLKKYKNGKPN